MTEGGTGGRNAWVLWLVVLIHDCPFRLVVGPPGDHITTGQLYQHGTCISYCQPIPLPGELGEGRPGVAGGMMGPLSAEPSPMLADGTEIPHLGLALASNSTQLVVSAEDLDLLIRQRSQDPKCRCINFANRTSRDKCLDREGELAQEGGHMNTGVGRPTPCRDLGEHESCMTALPVADKLLQVELAIH